MIDTRVERRSPKPVPWRDRDRDRRDAAPQGQDTIPASKSTWSGSPRTPTTGVRSGWRTANCEPVGYLPKSMASWLAPLIDKGKIHLDGYVPQGIQGHRRRDFTAR